MPSTHFDEADKPRSSAARVFSTLREDIIDLKLAPRSVLSRAALQDRFGLSSTPVRDALMRLEEEGLVQIFPQHATIVTPIDLARAEEGQFLRRSVETEVVRTLASRADREIVDRLRLLIGRQTAFAAMADHEAFTAADSAFHQAMYEAAGASRLWPVVQRHSGHIDRLRRLHLPLPGKMTEILKAHEAIAAGLERGDAGVATDALRDHLSRSLDFIKELRASFASYF